MPQAPYVVDKLISSKAIAARVEALAHEITDAFKDTDKLVVVGLLRGSFIFISSRPPPTAMPWNRAAKCAS
jgi:hypoxanthine phosphoribosyltransferase